MSGSLRTGHISGSVRRYYRPMNGTQWQRRVPSRCPVITVFKESWRTLKLQLSRRLPSEVIFGIYSASSSPALSLLCRFCRLYPDLRGVFLGIKISQQMVGSLGVCRAGKRVAELFKMTMDTEFLPLWSTGDSILHFSGAGAFAPQIVRNPVLLEALSQAIHTRQGGKDPSGIASRIPYHLLIFICFFLFHV